VSQLINNAKIRVVFFGTPVFAAFQLQALIAMPTTQVIAVITQPDRPSGRGQKLHASAVKEVALTHNIPILQPRSLKKELDSVMEFARATGPWDIGVVAAYGLIIPQAILDLPKKHCLNVHGSLLPRWRGAAPIQRSIMAGDAETGICLMGMEAGLDTGPVFVREAVAITSADTTGSLSETLAKLGAKLLQRDLSAIFTDEIKSEPQPESGVTYAEKILKTEGQIDWQKPASDIERLVRGLSPAPGAFTEVNGQRIKILHACAAADSPEAISPSNIGVSANYQGRLLVSCGSHTVLEILQLQPAGSKKMTAQEFQRGIKQ